MNKFQKFKQSVKDNYQKLGIAVGVALATSPVLAAPDVSSIVTEIAEAKTPVGAVAGASISVLVVMRVWALIRRAV